MPEVTIMGIIPDFELIKLVQKVEGKSLIADTEIERLANVTGGELTQEQLDAITADVLENIDLSGKVDKVTGSSLVTDTEITKLAGMPKITVSAIEPENPAAGDLWIDTN
jgi:hypothetical protein